MELNVLLMPCAFTLLVIWKCLSMKQKKHPVYYIRIFTILLGINLLMTSSLFAREVLVRDAHVEISSFNLDHFATLNPQQKQYYKNLENHHMKQGQYHFNKANQITLLIPNLTDREKALALFTQALYLSINKNLAGVVEMLKANLIGYAIVVYTQWQEIESNLNASKYNFEMADFYNSVCERG